MRRVAFLIALVLTVAACGGSDDASDTTSTTGSPPGPDGETTTTVGSGETPVDGIAASGDPVEAHYVGTLDDGTEFDSSIGKDPLSFTIDDGRMIKGFNDAVIGMAVGETKTVTFPPEEAYGPYLEDAIIEVPLTDLPEGVAAGDELISPTGSVVIVVAVGDELATLDTNHSLAGQNLTFEITLVSIDR